MAADESICQRAETAPLFKNPKNSVDEPQREYRLARFGGQPGYHDFFVLRPATFGDQLDPVSNTMARRMMVSAKANHLAAVEVRLHPETTNVDAHFGNKY